MLVLSKIGRIRVHWSRPLEGTPKTVTISREADGWSVAISCAEAPLQPLPPTGEETGIDLGLESFATLASGQPIFTPRTIAKPKPICAAANGGSPAARKAATDAQSSELLAKAHQHIRNQRRDFHHQEAHKLVQAYDVIYYEDLRVANMVQNHHLAKSITDAGWSAFLTILTFKAASAGKRVQAVNPAFTSQACSGCGAIVSQGLVRPLACLPGVRRQPASRPQRGAQHRAAGTGDAGTGDAGTGDAGPRDAVGGDTAFRRQREPLGCA